MSTNNNFDEFEKYSTSACTFYYTVMEPFGDEDEEYIAIYGCEGERAEYPAMINGIPVKDICKRENDVNPHRCKVAIFPEGIRRIWQSAFENSELLEEVVFPVNIKFIAFRAFAFCSKLKTITIPYKNMMGIPRSFQNSPNIEKIITIDPAEEHNLKGLITTLNTCILAIKDIEENNNKLGSNARKVYQDIKDWGWYDDVKELM